MVEAPPPFIEPLLAENVVRTRAERPIRMKAVTEPSGPAQFAGATTLFSATPSYVVALYEWRRRDVLAGVPVAEEA